MTKYLFHEMTTMEFFGLCKKVEDEIQSEMRRFKERVEEIDRLESEKKKGSRHDRETRLEYEALLEELHNYETMILDIVDGTTGEVLATRERTELWTINK